MDWTRQDQTSTRLDIFLLGPPGPERRRVALGWCERSRREVEYVALSPDDLLTVTAADGKTRYPPPPPHAHPPS